MSGAPPPPSRSLQPATQSWPDHQRRQIYKENLDFLGFNISKAGLRPNHKHTEAVRTYRTPQNKDDIARFTGLVNFFQMCIPKAAQLMQPLTDLMRKSAVFRWGESQDRAFQDTKKALVNATTLQHPSATRHGRLRHPHRRRPHPEGEA